MQEKYNSMRDDFMDKALEVLDKAIMTQLVNYVVVMDIKKFFDNIHYELMECLRQKILRNKVL